MCIGAERCARTCDTDRDCPKGAFCNEYGWCRRTRCESDWHCWRFICDLGTGTCRSSCFSNSDCQGGHYCLTDIYECIEYTF